MKAVIRLDVPDWQIGQPVSVFFKDTMVKKAVCEKDDNTIDSMKNLKEHLKAQIKTAKRLDSDWVYIRKQEAEKCLELAEAEDVIMDMLNGGSGSESSK